MGDEHLEIRTLKEKLLFYTTAFFILLGTFSMFAFLFLVPFVIEPAFTTIFMQFEEVPALCETYETEQFYGARNCSWSSCREGCTKDIYTCTQIRVNYRLNLYNFTNEFNFTEYHLNLKEAEREIPPVKRTDRYERALRDYEYDGAGDTLSHLSSNYVDYVHNYQNDNNDTENIFVGSVNLMNDERHPFDQILNLNGASTENISNYFFVNARLFPNVKGCGYPPMLNCTIWLKRYTKIGIKYPCYYSKVDPSLVISDLDYWQNTLNLVYSMAIPIPSFIISVIYLTYAYFKIYNEDEDTVPLDKNAEDMDMDEEAVDESGQVLASNAVGSHAINVGSISEDSCAGGVLFNGGPGMTTSMSQLGIVPTPSQLLIQSSVGSQISTHSDNSFGHQLKVQMADELSRESLDAIPSSPNSIQGNLSKTMTTSISTPPGPTAAV